MTPEQLAQRYGVASQYKKYDTQYQGIKEVIGWSWYDVNTYTSAATTNLRFFSTVRATLNLGNMRQQSQVPAPEAFFLRAIRVSICQQPFVTTVVADNNIQDGKINDVDLLSRTGVAQLTIGAKVYGQWPIWMLPAGGGVVPSMQTGDIDVAIQTASNGLQDPRAVYSLSKPLFIAPLMTFYIDLVWPAGALTLDAGDTTIEVIIDGDAIRPAQ